MAVAKTILSIDDSKAVHAFLDRCLVPDANGISFIHAYSVKEGLKALEENSTSVSAILLDWEMPEMTGLEGLPLIVGQFPKIPVIMLTTKNRPEDIMEMLGRGAAEYMMKPFTPDILFEKLKAVIGE